jgi:hypothetical protein
MAPVGGAPVVAALRSSKGDLMRNAAVAFAFAFLAGAFLTPLAREHAHRFGAVDHALSSRKVHTGCKSGIHATRRWVTFAA